LSLLFPINSTAVVDMDILTSAVARLDAVEFDMLWNRVIPTVAEITQDLLRVASTNREPSVLDYPLKESPELDPNDACIAAALGNRNRKAVQILDIILGHRKEFVPTEDIIRVVAMRNNSISAYFIDRIDRKGILKPTDVTWKNCCNRPRRWQIPGMRGDEGALE
jgi:hypothetical protein